MFLLGGARVLLGPTLVLCFLQGEKEMMKMMKSGDEDVLSFNIWPLS